MDSKELMEKLDQLPILKQRIIELVEIAANSGNAGEGIALADDAEEEILEVVRGLGKETMQQWADHRSKQVSLQLKKHIPSAKKNTKKKSDGKPPLVK